MHAEITITPLDAPAEAMRDTIAGFCAANEEFDADELAADLARGPVIVGGGAAPAFELRLAGAHAMLAAALREHAAWFEPRAAREPLLCADCGMEPEGAPGWPCAKCRAEAAELRRNGYAATIAS